MAADWSEEQQEAALAAASPDGSWLENQRQQLLAANMPAAHPNGPGITASRQSVQPTVTNRPALHASDQQRHRESAEGAEPAANEGRAVASQSAPEAQTPEPAGHLAAGWAAASTAGSPQEHARRETLVQIAGAASRGGTHSQGKTVAPAAALRHPPAGLSCQDRHEQVHAASDWHCTDASAHGRPWSAGIAQADRPLPSQAPPAHGARNKQGSTADSAGAAPGSSLGEVQAKQPPPAETHDGQSAWGRTPAGAAAQRPGKLSVGHETGLAAAGCDEDLLVLAAEVQRMEAELEQCNVLRAELADSKAEVRFGLVEEKLIEVHAAACTAGSMCSACAQQLAVMLMWSAQAMSTCC